jgi:CMP/dCMP kinase
MSASTAQPGDPVIAIDGPAASGKSTVAKSLAKALGGTYVSTGDMYRAVTWAALQRGLLPEQQSDEVIALLPTLDLQLRRAGDGLMALWLAGEPATPAALRTPAVSAQVSHVARLGAVREWLVARQRACRELGLMVMEGRDIGTVVFPAARHKFFLTASPLERARRRLSQGGETVDGATLQAVTDQIAERDRLDSTRAIAPLRPADDAILVDSSTLSVAEVVALLLAHIKGH